MLSKELNTGGLSHSTILGCLQVREDSNSATPPLSPRKAAAPLGPYFTHLEGWNFSVPPTSALPGSTFTAYTELPHEKTTSPTARVVKLFLGGLPDYVTKDTIAAIATHFTGFSVWRDNVIIFKKERDTEKSGSGVIHLPDVDAAQRFMNYSKKLVLEENGVRMHGDVDVLAAYSRKVRCPHPLVIEPARTPSPPTQKVGTCLPVLPNVMHWAAPMLPTPFVLPQLPPAAAGRMQVGYDMFMQPMYVSVPHAPLFPGRS